MYHGVADDLGISRVTVRKYVRSEGVPKPKLRTKRGSKLDAYTEYIDVRLAEGFENCVVLLREIRELGYDGGYTVLKDYVHPRRRPRQPKATMRFETGPGEQAQVDWGVVSYEGEDGRKHRMWAFVMVLGFSHAIYLEFVRRADVATFIRCHLNAFDYLGGVPKRCLYDNAKVVVIEHDDEDGDHGWNSRMLDFARRVGFELSRLAFAAGSSLTFLRVLWSEPLREWVQNRLISIKHCAREGPTDASVSQTG